MDKYDFIFHANRLLRSFEIEVEIKKFSNDNNLKLPSAFCQQDYESFRQELPQYPGFKYHILFLARPKTADEILGEQIEFQIKQLEQ